MAGYPIHRIGLAFLSAALLTVCAYYLRETVGTAEENLARSGWVLYILNQASGAIGISLLYKLCLIIAALSISFHVSLAWEDTFETMISKGIATLLISTNPLLVWCMLSLETMFIPVLSLLLWKSCLDLRKQAFSQSSVTTGLALVFFILSTPETLFFSLPLFMATILLVPGRLIIRYGYAPFFTLIAPMFFTILAITYWSGVTTGVFWPLPTSASTDSETSFWLARHSGELVVVLGELAVWAVLLSPITFLRLVNSATGNLGKRLVLFVMAVALTAAALATDRGVAATPYPYLATLVSAQIVIPHVPQEKFRLASLYLSWLGSFFVIWYYGL